MKLLAIITFAAAVVSFSGKPCASQDVKVDRAEADSKKAQDNLKQITLAFHEYHDAHGHFPPFAIQNQKGSPLLSWRVAVLPFLKEVKLHESFKLDQPWDSPHNKALMKKMPAVYRLPGAKGHADDGTTHCRVFTGPGTPFEANGGHRFGEITDGLGNTMLVMEATEGTAWTKPDELAYAVGKPIPKVGGLFRNGFLAAYLDGSVKLIRNDYDEMRMRLAIIRNDGLGLPEEAGQP